jgi:hypothetical protein
VKVYVIDKDGREARMSPRETRIFEHYFLTGYILDPQWWENNALPTIGYGTAINSAIRREAERCAVRGDAPLKIRTTAVEAVKKLHDGLLDPAKPWPSFIKFPPFHFLQGGTSFEAMSTIDPASIVAYQFRWEARCIVETPTGFEHRVIASSQQTISAK